MSQITEGKILQTLASGESMIFPSTVGEFMESYKMTDTEQVYSNGIEYVPIFRMRQWFEHEKERSGR